MIYDLDSAYIEDLSQAFAAGEARGRQQCDKRTTAELAELRKQLDRYDRFESICMNVFACTAVIGAWGVIAFLVTHA